MTRYSVQPRDRIFVKGYGFFSFTKNMGKNTGKNLNYKYSQKRLDHAKQSATDAHRTASKRGIQNTAEAIGDLIGNKIADEITKVSRPSSLNSLETVTNKAENIRLDREILKERYIFAEKRQKMTVDLKLI